MVVGGGTRPAAQAGTTVPAKILYRVSLWELFWDRRGAVYPCFCLLSTKIQPEMTISPEGPAQALA